MEEYIGLEAEHETGYEKLLLNLFKGINYDDYDWLLSEVEIIEESGDEITSNFDGEVKSPDFAKFVDQNMYIVSLNLQIYKANDDTKEIKTYQDFKKSLCEMILLIHDNSFIEIYFKNNELRNKVLENLERLKISYEFKTEESDARYTIQVE